MFLLIKILYRYIISILYKNRNNGPLGQHNLFTPVPQAKSLNPSEVNFVNCHLTYRRINKIWHPKTRSTILNYIRKIRDYPTLS